MLQRLLHRHMLTLEARLTHLLIGLPTKQSVDVTIILNEFRQLSDVAVLHLLRKNTNARGIEHRLVLNGGQAVVEYLVLHVQTVLFKIHTRYIVLALSQFILQ